MLKYVDKINVKHNRSVSFSNAITRASHGLSLSEKRIIMLAVSKLDSMKPFDLDGSLLVKIDAKEYSDFFNLDKDTAYTQLTSAASELFNRKITFHCAKASEPITTMRWVAKSIYFEGKAYIELVFWHEIIPYLMNLNTHFTTYKLQQASKFKSIYTWRLFELLTQFSNKCKIDISIDDFNHAMESTQSMKRDFGNIRNRVILPAIRELEEKNGWVIQWGVRKNGRKIIGLTFEYK